MIEFSISGGATNFAPLATAAKTTIEYGYKPDVIIGVSSGALMAVPLALGMGDIILEISKKVKPLDFFKVPPVNKYGNITFRAAWRPFMGKLSFGLQDVSELLKSVVTPRLFEDYRHGNYANCYAMAVNASSGMRQVFDLKNCSYGRFIDYVQASCRIPIMTQPKEIAGQHYYDGGVLDHNASMQLLKKYNGQIKQLFSFYSRPKNHMNISFTWNLNIITVIQRTIDLMAMEISKTDAEIERLKCQDMGIDLTQIFTKKVDFLYQTDSNKLTDLVNQAIQSTINTLKNRQTDKK